MVFALLLARVVRKRYSLIFVITVCVASMVATQAIKTAMKSTFQEPRPFVTALFQDKTDDLSINTRATWACRNGKNRCNQNFVTAHQAKEVGYSFPSGHTIFAVSWLLLVVGFAVICEDKRSFWLIFCNQLGGVNAD